LGSTADDNVEVESSFIGFYIVVIINKRDGQWSMVNRLATEAATPKNETNDKTPARANG
jgi:hypothetical protein